MIGGSTSIGSSVSGEVVDFVKPFLLAVGTISLCDYNESRRRDILDDVLRKPAVLGHIPRVEVFAWQRLSAAAVKTVIALDEVAVSQRNAEFRRRRLPGILE